MLTNKQIVSITEKFEAGYYLFTIDVIDDKDKISFTLIDSICIDKESKFVFVDRLLTFRLSVDNLKDANTNINGSVLELRGEVWANIYLRKIATWEEKTKP